jgi:hypothetical protein
LYAKKTDAKKTDAKKTDAENTEAKKIVAGETDKPRKKSRDDEIHS